LNPFCVAITQGIAGISVLSGSEFRFPMWLGFTLLCIVFTMRYAHRIQQQPSYQSDAYFREHHANTTLGSVDLCCTNVVQQCIGSHININASDTILA